MDIGTWWNLELFKELFKDIVTKSHIFVVDINEDFWSFLENLQLGLIYLISIPEHF